MKILLVCFARESRIELPVGEYDHLDNGDATSNIAQIFLELDESARKKKKERKKNKIHER